MIKRFIVFIFISILWIVNIRINNITANADDLIPLPVQEPQQVITPLKINSINFDNSDSIIFLGTSGTNVQEDTIKINKSILSEPNRVILDIENAIITFPNSSYELKNSRLTRLKIAQNSTNPNVVRIVIQYSQNYDVSKINILKIKNNIIIKLSNETPLQQYLTQIYKETKGSSVEYNDKAIAIPEVKTAPESDEIFNRVQEAFKTDDSRLVRPNIEQKQAKLKSRFFLEQIEAKAGNLFISGIGVVNTEKPFILTDPVRIVFDLPNTIVKQELRDKEIKLNETDIAKIGQFEPSKARIVINTNNINKYIPVYPSNLQTLIIAGNSSYLQILDPPAELSYFKEQDVNTSTDVINIMFTNPITYSIQRGPNKLNIIIYNLSNFDVEAFNSLAATNGTGIEAKKLSQNTYKISFPVNSNTLVDCYEAINASQLRLVFSRIRTTAIISQHIEPQTPQTEPQPKKSQIDKDSPFADLMERAKNKSAKETVKKNSPKKKIPAVAKIKNKVIIIDPGHGGNDTGAMRGRILEKNITLQIALKVRKILQDYGFNKVVMTRTGDTTISLADRVETANSRNADIYVSIHINASVKSEVKGVETHYYTEKGLGVAKVIHKNAEDRGLFKSKFYVINHTEAPAVLLELGFISNEQERNSLISEKRQQESAQAIAEGIINYLLEHKND